MLALVLVSAAIAVRAIAGLLTFKAGDYKSVEGNPITRKLGMMGAIILNVAGFSLAVWLALQPESLLILLVVTCILAVSVWDLVDDIRVARGSNSVS